MFTVTSYSAQGFSEVANASCRLVDERGGSEVARFDLSATGPHTAMIMATVYRQGGGWKMAAIGDTGKGKTYKDMTAMIRNVG